MRRLGFLSLGKFGLVPEEGVPLWSPAVPSSETPPIAVLPYAPPGVPLPEKPPAYTLPAPVLAPATPTTIIAPPAAIVTAMSTTPAPKVQTAAQIYAPPTPAPAPAPAAAALERQRSVGGPALVGAAGGFFVGGPIGALVGAAAGLIYGAVGAPRQG